MQLAVLKDQVSPQSLTALWHLILRLYSSLSQRRIGMSLKDRSLDFLILASPICPTTKLMMDGVTNWEYYSL